MVTRKKKSNFFTPKPSKVKPKNLDKILLLALSGTVKRVK